MAYGPFILASPASADREALTGAGVISLDDIAMLAWVMKNFDGELDAFRQWRARQSPEKLVAAERLPATQQLLEQEKAKD